MEIVLFGGDSNDDGADAAIWTTMAAMAVISSTTAAMASIGTATTAAIGMAVMAAIRSVRR